MNHLARYFHFIRKRRVLALLAVFLLLVLAPQTTEARIWAGDDFGTDPYTCSGAPANWRPSLPGLVDRSWDTDPGSNHGCMLRVSYNGSPTYLTITRNDIGVYGQYQNLVYQIEFWDDLRRPYGLDFYVASGSYYVLIAVNDTVFGSYYYLRDGIRAYNTLIPRCQGCWHTFQIYVTTNGTYAAIDGRVFYNFINTNMHNATEVGIEYPNWGKGSSLSYWDNFQVLEAPASTTSRYVTVNDPNTLYDQGRRLAGQSGIIVLDFGSPASVSGEYGTLLPARNTFVSVSRIWELAYSFIQGYYNYSPPGSFATVVIGTNNSGMGVTRDHGIAWAQLVDSVYATIVLPPVLTDKVVVAGGTDAELGYNTPTPTKAWVGGYNAGSVYRMPYYDFGDCAGCGYPTNAPSSPWTWEDVWYISWGAPLGYPLPLIYNRTGANANSWYTMSRYAREKHGVAMRFKGAFTQYDACHDPQNPGGPDCLSQGLDNTPSEGWLQLYTRINSDPLTRQGDDLPWVTDVTWKQ